VDSGIPYPVLEDSTRTVTIISSVVHLPGSNSDTSHIRLNRWAGSCVVSISKGNLPSGKPRRRNPRERSFYLIREDAAESETEGWLAPEPADEVIVAEVLDSTDLSREDVEPLGEHVDFERLHELLAGDSEADTLTFTVEEIEVTASADGSVTVSP